MAAQTPVCEFGWMAVDFALPGIDGKTYNLERVRGPKGTLVMFICNHCPYVKAVIGRIVRDVHDLAAEGIGAIAINANDPVAFPEDSFDKMKAFAKAEGIDFPYVFDETQEIARAYDAACTPDFFGFDRNLGLQYRGRLDESKTNLVPNARRELFEAMRQVARTGHGPGQQIPSMGCSIKWRAA